MTRPLMPVASILATATAAKSGQTVAATINGVATVVHVARDLSVASGDVLLVVQYGTLWVAVGRMFAAAPAQTFPDVPPAPDPVITTGYMTVPPVETRTYQNSSWRTDNDNVYQGEYGGTGLRTGCVFYGSQPRSLAGATVTAARIQVRREAGGAFAAQTATMRLMTQSTRPGGAPTLTSSTTGPSLATNTSTVFTVPTAWAQSIVDGTAGGLAFYDGDGNPYMVFAGRSRWSPAFTMTIDWRR